MDRISIVKQFSAFSHDAEEIRLKGRMHFEQRTELRPWIEFYVTGEMIVETCKASPEFAIDDGVNRGANADISDDFERRDHYEKDRAGGDGQADADREFHDLRESAMR